MAGAVVRLGAGGSLLVVIVPTATPGAVTVAPTVTGAPITWTVAVPARPVIVVKSISTIVPIATIVVRLPPATSRRVADPADLIHA